MIGSLKSVLAIFVAFVLAQISSVLDFCCAVSRFAEKQLYRIKHKFVDLFGLAIDKITYAGETIISILQTIFKYIMIIGASCKIFAKYCLSLATRAMSNWAMKCAKMMIKFVVRLAGLKTSEDVLTLSSGRHEIRIDTGCVTPLKVWLTFEDACNDIPVCSGSVNQAGVQLGDGFFVVYADVASNVGNIHWLAILK